MADEAFFLMRWIQAFNGMSWVQLRVNLRSATMPPMLEEFLAGTPPRKLFLLLNMLLELHNGPGELQDQYTVKESGHLHLYPGIF